MHGIRPLSCRQYQSKPIRHMSYSLSSLEGDLADCMGSAIGIIKEDTRSVDYRSHGVTSGFCPLAIVRRSMFGVQENCPALGSTVLRTTAWRFKDYMRAAWHQSVRRRCQADKKMLSQVCADFVGIKRTLQSESPHSRTMGSKSTKP